LNHCAGAQIDVNDVHGSEPSDYKVSAVLSRHKIDCPVVTCTVGFSGGGDVSLNIGKRDIDLRHHSTLWICQNALDNTAIQLRPQINRQTKQERCRHSRQPY
jgi:hypothetical protein